MVLSCLVEPLVSPLTGRDTSGHRRTALTGTRLLATALAMSALATVSNMAEAEEIAAHAAQVEQTHVVRSAHKKSDPIPYHVLLQTEFLIRLIDADVGMPEESPWFETKALDTHRLKNKRDIAAGLAPRSGAELFSGRLHGGAPSPSLRI
jgi:hypothetical protein